MHGGIGAVAGISQLLKLLIVSRVLLRLADHALNILIRQAGRGLNGDLLLFAGALILSRHMDNAVGIDIEGHFNLRHAARSRRDAL